MSIHDEKPTSDFPEENLTPVRRHAESQALIRLRRENTGPIVQLDGPDVEPLTPLSRPTDRTRWIPWIIIGLLLTLGVALWVRHLVADKPSLGGQTTSTDSSTPDEKE